MENSSDRALQYIAIFICICFWIVSAIVVQSIFPEIFENYFFTAFTLHSVLLGVLLLTLNYIFDKIQSSKNNSQIIITTSQNTRQNVFSTSKITYISRSFIILFIVNIVVFVASLYFKFKEEQVQMASLDAVTVSFMATIVAAVGTVSTFVFNWKKEQRDKAEANLKMEKLELEVAELKKQQAKTNSLIQIERNLESVKQVALLTGKNN